jgi:hypothetical protein
MLNDNFLSLVLFSLLVAIFFATFYRVNFKSGLKSFLKTFLYMVAGSLIFAYFMFWTGK